MYSLRHLITNLLIIDHAKAVCSQNVDQATEDHERENAEHAAFHVGVCVDSE